MITNKANYSVETSEQELLKLDYTIASPAIVFEILCTKLYDNPLLVSIQEYMCNARDAHREKGNTHEPIRVILPTKFDNTLKIQDYGVGLSPERVKEVFVVLGKSTKSDSDLFTGGFGVGAKSGWAYTDSFTVKTQYDGTEYVYVAYIGEEGVGKLDLVYSEPTNEENGTTIEMTIKIDDFKDAELYVYRTSHFWEVRPTIVNSTHCSYIDSYSEKYYIDGEHIATSITNLNHINYLPNSNNGQISMVLDGIIYNEITDLGELPINYNLSVSSSDGLFLHYDVSELRPSINRKSVMIQKNTLEVAHSKLIKLINLVNNKIYQMIDNATSVNDLLDIIKEISVNNCMFLIDQWETTFNGYPLTYKRMNGFYFKVPSTYYNLQIYNYSRMENILKYKTSTYTINLSNILNNCVVFNDKYTKTFDKAAVKEYLKKHQLSTLMLISPDIQAYDKETIIEESAEFLTFIDAHAVKYSDIKKEYGNLIKSGERKGRLTVRRVSNSYRNEPSINLFDIMDDYDYIVMEWESFNYNGISPLSVIKQYNRLDDVKFIFIKASDASAARIRKLSDYEDKFITVEKMIDIMYDFLLTKIDMDVCVTKVSESFDVDPHRLYTIRSLRTKLNEIQDKRLHTTFSQVIEFESRCHGIRSRHNGNNISKLTELANTIYKAKNYGKDSIVVDFRTEMVSGIIKRKTKKYSREITHIFDKYPLLDTIYNNRHNENMINAMVDYINVFFACKPQQQGARV